MPIVYAALGATGGLFASNLVWYKRFQKGVSVVSALGQAGNTVRDSSQYFALHRLVKSYYKADGLETLRHVRDDSRTDMTYSALYFLMAWALNVVDATVDAHLGGFDVSPDLSLNIRPGYDHESRTAGLSFLVKRK